MGSICNPEGEPSSPPMRLQFDGRLKLEFHGSRFTSNAGLRAYSELDDALGLATFAGAMLADTRTGKNVAIVLPGSFASRSIAVSPDTRTSTMLIAWYTIPRCAGSSVARLSNVVARPPTRWAVSRRNCSRRMITWIDTVHRRKPL